MSDGWPERDWFEKADQDLELARRALGPGKPLPGMACYHAQQCAEKYLKGYLISHSVPFRFVHDLVYLVSARKPLYRSFPVTIHHTFRASCSPISSRKMPAIGLGGVIGGGPAPIFGTRP